MLRGKVKPMRLSLSLLALVLGLVACSNESSPPASEGGGITPPPTQKPPSTGPVAPDEPTSPADDPNAKPCTGSPGEIYALSARKLAGTEDVPLCRYKGKVMLILNGASKCGQTYQYKPLQALYERHQAAGLEILAFPSRDFAEQEFEKEADVSDFCTKQYAIKFPLFATAPVTGANIQPVFKWLLSQPGYEKPIPWNFEKFLVDRTGKLVKRFAYDTNPDPSVDPTVEKAIKEELAK
jgi:glutathione peroxidase